MVRPVSLRVVGRGLLGVLSTVVLASACGSATTEPGAQPVGDPTSLPLVDLSRAPVADDPDPSARSGAASTFLDCVHGVWQGGWASDFGPLGDGSTPDAAIGAMVDDNILGLPVAELRAVGRAPDRVLYGYDVAGSAKLTVVVADSSNVELDTEERWAVETFASCDPAEFDPAVDDRLPFTIWEDDEGNRVPTSVIRTMPGAEHCSWESATFLSLDGAGYVADPEGVLWEGAAIGPFDGDADLPADAVDTGYRHARQVLWLSADGTTAFMVTEQGVEAWPALTEPIACG